MSRYLVRPLDFHGLKTIPLAERGGKVQLGHFARPYRSGEGLMGLVDSLPRLLAADSFRGVAEAILSARANGKPVIWGMGGHVIKCGLAPVLLDLMRRRFVTAFALNGSAAIHDFEIAVAGQTSEDVEAVLPDGRFGAAEETGREMAESALLAVRERVGLGEAIGRRLEMLHPGHHEYSLLCGAFAARVPVTVHVAVGTDTPHTFPELEPAALGEATHRDFRLLSALVRQMHDGGVYINCGSAVVLPEVFLKALSVVRNLGFPVLNFTTANLDFLQHYRPKVNVVDRPHASAGGRGFTITGHHELTVPLLAAVLIECES